jgi:hypothetical protein
MQQGRPLVRDWLGFRAFRVVLDDDLRNIRQFREEHPDTDIVMLACFISVLVGVLIGL